MGLYIKRARISAAAIMFAAVAVFTSAYIHLVPRAYADVDGPWTYTVSDGEVTIDAYDFAVGGATPNVPSSLGGYPVVVLGDGVFADMDITAVAFPNTLKTINPGAFSGTDLTSVSFPNSLETIGNGAFSRVPLASISVPDSVTRIAAGAFSDTNATTITVGTPNFSGTPSLVIEGGAFSSIPGPVTVTIYNNLSSISSGTMPGGMTSLTIGTDDFSGTPTVVIPSFLTSGLSDFTTLTLGKNVLEVEPYAFIASGLTTVNLSEGITYIGESAFMLTPLSSVEIPSTVTALAPSVFRETALTSIDIPATILTIGDYAFQDTPLSSVTMHEGTTTLGSHVFSGTDITEFTLPSSVTTLGNSIFANTPMENLTIGSTSFSGEPTFIVTPGPFDGMNAIKTITFGKNVKAIGASAFTYDNTLETIYLADTIETIGEYAFTSTSLTSLTLPSSVTTIGDAAFSSTDIISLHIPLSVTSIGEGAFSNIPMLTSITIGDPNFSGTPTLHIPDDFVGGATALATVVIGKNVGSIGSGAFGGALNLTVVTIPESVTSISDYAFASTGLTSVTILGNPTLGEGVFLGAGLDSHFLPEDTVPGSPQYTFRQNNSQLVQIHAPNAALAATLGSSRLYTNRTLAHLYSSSDSGESWAPMTTPATSGWKGVVGSSDGSKLISHVGTFEENSHSVYSSNDSGTTWTPRVPQSADFYLVDIASNSTGSLLAGIQNNTSNSTQGNVFTSTDGGATWVPGTTPNTRGFNSIASSADGTKLVATAYRSSNNTNTNVYTSTDSGATWAARTTPNSRYWIDVASSDDGTYLLAFTDYGGSLYSSSNSGLTWTARSTSRPWRAIAISGSGQYAVAVAGDRNVYTSSDYGVSWIERPSSGARQWTSVDMSASGQYILAADSNNGYADDEGWLYYSADYGVTWTKKEVGTQTHNWTSVFMSDDGMKLFAVNWMTELSSGEETFATSGYIVNPASVDAAFVGGNNVGLSSPLHYTARIAGIDGASDTYRTDYKLIDAVDRSNLNAPVLQLDPYFRKGGAPFTLTPPAISGYVTPETYTYTFANSGSNQHTFVYSPVKEAENKGDDETITSGGDKSSGGTNVAGTPTSGDDTPLRADDGDMAVAPDGNESAEDAATDNEEPSGAEDTADSAQDSGIHPAWVIGGGVVALLVGILVAHWRHRSV